MGPCLCGDPYCSSCGDPGLEKIEDAADKVASELCNNWNEMAIYGLLYALPSFYNYYNKAFGDGFAQGLEEQQILRDYKDE